MTTDRLDRDKLHWIIRTYDIIQLAGGVPDVPTLLFEELGFSEQEVRQAMGLRPEDDLMDWLDAYLREFFGIGDLGSATLVCLPRGFCVCNCDPNIRELLPREIGRN